MLRLIWKHLKAIGIGALLCGLVMTIVVGVSLGGPGSKVGFLDLLGLWVLCTGAIILGPMILVAWLVGLLVVSFIEMLKKPRSGPDMIPVLMNYIQSAKRQGIPKAKMEAVMMRAGWSDVDIAEAYRRLDGK